MKKAVEGGESMHHLEKKRYPYLFLVPALIIFGVFFLLPTVLGFIYSLTDWDIDSKAINFIGFDNFKYLLSRDVFLKAFTNTVIFGVVTAIFKNIFGLGLALGVNKDLKTKNYLRALFYIPGVLSMIVVGIMFNSIFAMDGMLNQLLTTIGLDHLTTNWLGNKETAMLCIIFLEIWKWSGFHMIIYLAGLQTIPKELMEASTVDGANKIQQLWHITLPMLMPSITINTVLSLIGGFKVFEQVYVLTNGGPGNHTQVLNTLVFQSFSQGFYGRGSAMGLILVVFISVISILTNKFLRSKEVVS